MPVRVALGRDDQDVLAGFTGLLPHYLGWHIATTDDSLDALRAAVEHVQRLLLLREVAQDGEAVVGDQDVPPLIEFLWVEARESHECARGGRVWGGEAARREYVDGELREAEVCARLIEQLGVIGGGDA